MPETVVVSIVRSPNGGAMKRVGVGWPRPRRPHRADSPGGTRRGACAGPAKAGVIGFPKPHSQLLRHSQCHLDECRDPDVLFPVRRTLRHRPMPNRPATPPAKSTTDSPSDATFPKRMNS